MRTTGPRPPPGLPCPALRLGNKVTASSPDPPPRSAAPLGAFIGCVFSVTWRGAMMGGECDAIEEAPEMDRTPGIMVTGEG